ncbi:MAG TPA: hypothetical protein VLQ68_06495 [Rhizobiaceae bacterium]|nr:hypothetical protein [Rhizobiaceae bacterium]
MEVAKSAILNFMPYLCFSRPKFLQSLTPKCQAKLEIALPTGGAVQAPSHASLASAPEKEDIGASSTAIRDFMPNPAHRGLI